MYVVVADIPTSLFAAMTNIYKAGWGKQLIKETFPVQECVSEVIMDGIILFE